MTASSLAFAGAAASASSTGPGGEAAVLHARARALAVKPDEGGAGPADADSLEILEFSLAGERYAIETRSVRGIHPLQGMVPLPCAPDCVLGIVNLRGQVVPVLGFRGMLGLPEMAAGAPANIVLVHDDEMECGLPVAGAAAVRCIPQASLQPGLPGLGETARRCIRGITADGITLLDVAGIFSHPRLQLAGDTDGITNLEYKEET